MDTERTADQCLAGLLDEAAREYAGHHQGHTSLKRYILYLHLDPRKGDRQIIDRKRRILLQDFRACGLIEVQPGMTAEELCQEIANRLDNAAEQAVAVENLNEIQICLIASGNVDEAMLEKIEAGVSQYHSRMAGKRIRYLPFLLIEDQSKDENKPAEFTRALNAIEQFAQRNKTVGNCCILSGLDERGFSVPHEQLLNTILSISIFSESSLQHHTDGIGGVQSAGERLAGFLYRPRSEWGIYTARGVVVENPIRSMLCSRMRDLLGSLSGKISWERKSEQKYDQRKICVQIFEDALRRVLQKRANVLPRMYLNGEEYIDTRPVYSVMDGDGFEPAMQALFSRYDVFSECEDMLRNGMMRELLRACMDKNYLREMEEWLTDCREEDGFCVENSPLRTLMTGRMLDDRWDRWKKKEEQLIECIETVYRNKWNSLLEGERQDHLWRQQFQRIVHVMDQLDEMLKQGYQHMKHIEIPLNTRDQRSNNPYPELEKWSIGHSDQKEDMRRRFIQLLLERVNVDRDWEEGLRCSLLEEILYPQAMQIVLKTDKEYINALLQACHIDQKRSEQYANELREKMVFPVSLNQSPQLEFFCTAGEGKLFNELSQKLVHDETAFSCLNRETDRIEVLRISRPFSKQELTWYQTEDEEKEK